MLQVHRQPTSRTPSQWCDSALASPGVPAEGPRVWTLRLPPLLRPAQGLVIKGLLQSGSSACATSIFKNVQRFRCLFERLEKPASARIPHVFDGRRRPRGMKCIANVRDSAGSEEKEQPVPLMPLTLECRVGVGGGAEGRQDTRARHPRKCPVSLGQSSCSFEPLNRRASQTVL